jgi:uncharacterized membrane protein
MDDDVMAYFTIFLMAVVVGLTRISGAEAMSFVRISPRVETALNSMATSVLVALVASEVFRGDIRTVTVIAAAVVVVLLSRSSMIAMIIATAVAALWTYVAAGNLSSIGL